MSKTDSNSGWTIKFTLCRASGTAYDDSAACAPTQTYLRTRQTQAPYLMFDFVPFPIALICAIMVQSPHLNPPPYILFDFLPDLRLNFLLYLLSGLIHNRLQTTSLLPIRYILSRVSHNPQLAHMKDLHIEPGPKYDLAVLHNPPPFILIAAVVLQSALCSQCQRG